jgi:phosphocarrier protein
VTTRDVRVTNALGMHARAAARFVNAAARFQASIRVGRDRTSTDGKSILGLLLLSARRGVVLTISAEGPDEATAVESLARLVDMGFGESS